MSEPVNKDEFQMRIRVIGKSTIDHRLRLDMKLTLEEYVLLDFIHTHNQTSKEIIFFKDYYRETGMLKEDMLVPFKTLKEKGFLIFNVNQNRVDVSELWTQHFESTNMANKLWNILPKGNKTTVKQRIPKVMKIISAEEITAKLKAYVKHCDDNDIYKKGLDVWLNPNKLHWDDPLVPNPLKGNKPVIQQKVQIKFKQQ